MNVQLKPDAFRRTAKTRSLRGFTFKPDLMDQVVAGLLWMSLDLPEDVSRPEMEMLARQLVLRIRADTDKAALEQDVALLQLEQFCRPPNFPAIRDVVRRAVTAVNGF
jgi:hypothetical protein